MAACPAKVQSLNRAAVWNSVGEADFVVHVMDVAAGDAEITLDFGRREDERLANQLGGAGRESVADRKQVLHIELLLTLPAAVLERIRHPLDEQRRAVPALCIS